MPKKFKTQAETLAEMKQDTPKEKPYKATPPVPGQSPEMNILKRMNEASENRKRPTRDRYDPLSR